MNKGLIAYYVNYVMNFKKVQKPFSDRESAFNFARKLKEDGKATNIKVVSARQRYGKNGYING